MIHRQNRTNINQNDSSSCWKITRIQYTNTNTLATGKRGMSDTEHHILLLRKRHQTDFPIARMIPPLSTPTVANAGGFLLNAERNGCLSDAQAYHAKALTSTHYAIILHTHTHTEHTAQNNDNDHRHHHEHRHDKPVEWRRHRSRRNVDTVFGARAGHQTTPHHHGHRILWVFECVCVCVCVRLCSTNSCVRSIGTLTVQNKT